MSRSPDHDVAASDAQTLAATKTAAPPPSATDTRSESSAGAPIDPLARTGDGQHPTGGIRIGATVGRYVVVKFLGAGGMGAVFGAYDPELDRRVALKVLLEQDRPTSEETRQRLVREAQAMAKLSHPNVITVHDAGTMDDRVFLAMEHVDGDTLTRWLEAPRTWRAILQVFLDAGRGLQAAHDEGLVHRDFKPDNVMIDERDRVRVMDFGLARADPEAIAPPPLDDAHTSGDSALASDLTAAGSVMGTPAFMAPEQFKGETTDARTDQFSYCVSLWTALYGERPFRGKSVFELCASVCAGRIARPPSRTVVPKRLHRAMLRGLSTNPDERWPTMAALLEALADDPWARARPYVAAAAVLTGAAGLAWMFGGADGPRCDAAAGLLEGGWGEQRRHEVQTAMTSADVPFADDAWGHVQRRLDAWTEQWAQGYLDACEATHVRGDQSASVLDLRMACLQRARLDLEATTTALSQADAEFVAKAHRLVEALPQLDSCADAEALLAGAPPPSDAEARQVEAISASLAESTAQRLAGQIPIALERAREAQASMSQIDYQPIRTEVWLTMGFAQEAAGHSGDALSVLRRAVEHGTRNRQRDHTRVALLRTMYVQGISMSEHDEALALLPIAQGLTGDDARDQAELALVVAGIRVAQGKPDTAVDSLREALEHLLVEMSPDDPVVLEVRYDLAVGLMEQGRFAEAESEHRLVLEQRRATLGPHHPDIAQSLSAVASSLYYQGKYAQAEAEHRAALEIRIDALGPDHPVVAHSQNGIANATRAQGNFDAAVTMYRAAIDTTSRALGPDHPNVANTRNNLAVALLSLKRYDDAEREFRAALAQQAETLGEEHIQVGRTHYNLGKLARLRDDLDGAVEHFGAAARIREASLGAEHPDLGRSLAQLGEALLERGDADAATEPARRAWAILEASSAPDQLRAHAAFLQARLLAARDREGARALAARALEIDPGGRLTDEIRNWLAARP